MLRRRCTAIVLLSAALLLAAQALGLAHRIEHANPAVATATAAAPAHAADDHHAQTHDCAALDAAALGCALPAQVLAVADRAAGSEPLPTACAAPPQSGGYGYRSRAPPPAG